VRQRVGNCTQPGFDAHFDEHSVFDEKLGRIMTRSLSDYHVPVNADVGSVEPVLLEEEDAHRSQ